MPEDLAATDAVLARARLRGKRLALGVVFAVTFAFVGQSVFEIIPAVFGARVRPLPSSPAGTSARQCAEGVKRLSEEPAWTEAGPVEQACGGSSEGLDAWASLLRLHLAQERLAGRDLADLDVLRRDVTAHLPPDLR